MFRLDHDITLALITVGIPAIATLVGVMINQASDFNKRSMKKLDDFSKVIDIISSDTRNMREDVNSLMCKQQRMLILQLVQTDENNDNREKALTEYDKYIKLGGNTYVKSLLKEKGWIDE